MIHSLKDAVKHIPPEDLERHGVIVKAKTRANGKPTYICTLCGNGEGANGDGLVVYENSDGYAYHCYKKGCHFDNISLLALHYNLAPRNDFTEILRRAADEFCIASDFENYHSLEKISVSSSTAFKDKKANTLAQAEPSIDQIKLASLIEHDIARAIDCLEELPEKDRRGLSPDTLRYFRCGYHPYWIHPKIRIKTDSNNVQKLCPTRRIIIPVTLEHYVAVALDSDRPQIKENYWKQIAKTSRNTAIFGRQTINNQTSYIYVFEGEIDAMSAWQSYQQQAFLKKSMNLLESESAVALKSGKTISPKDLKNNAYIATGGAAKTDWVEVLDKLCKYYRINPRIIILFDNDDAGTSNAEKRRKDLINLGYPTITRFFKE